MMNNDKGPVLITGYYLRDEVARHKSSLPHRLRRTGYVRVCRQHQRVSRRIQSQGGRMKITESHDLSARSLRQERSV